MTKTGTHLRQALREIAYQAEAVRTEQAMVPPSWALPELIADRFNAAYALQWARQRDPGYDHRFPD